MHVQPPPVSSEEASADSHATVREKVPAIGKSDADDELSKHHLEEEKVAGKLHQVEQQRLRLIGEMHNRFYPDQRVISLSTIIQFAPEPMKQQLRESRLALLENVKKLQQVNDLNRTLCEQSLSTVTYYFNVLTTAVEETPARYDMHARETEPSRHNLLDRTA